MKREQRADSLLRVFAAAGADFMDDKAPRLAAALSYYTAFSLPPLLVLVIGVAGVVYDVDVVREKIMAQVATLVGTASATALGDAVTDAQRTTGAGGALAVGLITLLVGASGAFGQLQDSLNTIWEVEPKKGAGIWRLLRSRLLSFGTILGTGFLLLVSLTISAAVGALVRTVGDAEWLAPFIASLDVLASLLVVTCLFALIFKVLPDIEIDWRDVWAGAALTAGLFVVGKFAIGFYLGLSDVGSAYGAAGSVVVILVWIYYSSLILFYGAEFTQAWAAHRRANTDAIGIKRAVSDDDVPAPQLEFPWVMTIAAAVALWIIGRKRNSRGASGS